MGVVWYEWFGVVDATTDYFGVNAQWDHPKLMNTAYNIEGGSLTLGVYLSIMEACSPTVLT